MQSDLGPGQIAQLWKHCPNPPRSHMGLISSQGTYKNQLMNA